MSTPAPAIDADEMLAGFIVWLARHDLPAVRRQHYHAHAERFLRWQAHGPDAHADRTQSRYLKQLRLGGDADLGAALTALSLLARYRVTAPRATWRPPTRRKASATLDAAGGSGAPRRRPVRR
jgi:hypothetical protein